MSPRPATVSALREGAEQIAADAPDTPLPKVEHDTIAQALVAALKDLTMVKTGRTVDFTTDKGVRVHYDYADLGDVVKLTRPHLWRHGLVALTPVHDHGQGLACTVTLLHESGERMDLGPFPFPHGRDAQATGSMVTYHRRYALVAALGMAAGDDDDGAAAQPAFVWTVGAVKAALLNLFDGDKTKAAEAWRLGHGDNEPPDAGLAERLHAEWVANQPKDEPEAES